MTRIRLKPRSAEFADDHENKARSARGCDMPGCAAEGVHKAPRDRSLDSHYWFCLDHVSEYNKAWDFFSGMSTSEIEAHLIRSTLWDRPTRRFDNHKLEEDLKSKAWKTYHYTDKEPPKSTGHSRAGIDHSTPEFQALAILGLEPPLDIQAVKTRYKELAKKHHPDINRDNPQSEELLKKINMAYTILKMAFEKYEKLPSL